MGGRSSRTKGFGYEREIVNQAKDAGFEAERCYGSNGQSRGLHNEVDVVIGDEHFQAKRYKRVAQWLRPHEAVLGVIFREDGNTESLVCIPLSHYLKLKKENNDAKL
jgi:hypothetical protein